MQSSIESPAQRNRHGWELYIDGARTAAVTAPSKIVSVINPTAATTTHLRIRKVLDTTLRAGQFTC
jgi:hypothetical protein